MSQFAEFIQEKGVEPARIVQQSRALETLTPEDRSRRSQRSVARRNKKSYADAEAPKPDRFGRGVSLRTVTNAMEGKPVTRMNRKKIARALDAMLSPQGSEPVDIQKLFADAPKKKPKKK